MSTSSCSSTSSKKLTLKSGDGQVFEVEEAVAALSGTLSLLIDEDCSGGEICLPRISGEILSLVIEFLKLQHDVPIKTVAFIIGDTDRLAKEVFEDLSDDFINEVDLVKETIFNLTKAANYLNIDSLLNLACKTIAKSIEGKTVDEIHSAFVNVKNLSPEEEDKKIREEIGWPFN